MDVLERLKLNIGERVDIVVENGRVYRTAVEDTEGDELLVMPTPFYRGIPVIFRQGDEVSLNYFRDTGRYAVTALVAGFKTEGNLRMILFRPRGEVRRQQLRASYRLGVDLRGVLRDNMAGPFPFKPTPDDDEVEIQVQILDISETGLAFKSATRLEVGERIYVRIHLDWPSADAQPIEGTVQVRRCALMDDKRDIYRVGTEFVGLDNDTRKHIARFVLTRQQQILKQKRLVEGE